MIPKEKAVELIDKFIRYTPAEEEYELAYAKECALIAVQEVINNNPMYPVPHSQYYEVWSDRSEEAISYWIQVQEEINKL